MTARLMFHALLCGGLLAPALPAEAAGPRNPYSSFNLSGINYGAQQWERAQREGRRVWPYNNTPSGRPTSRSGGVSAGGFVGGGSGVIVQAGPSSRPAARSVRRWRR